GGRAGRPPRRSRAAPFRGRARRRSTPGWAGPAGSSAPAPPGTTPRGGRPARRRARAGRGGRAPPARRPAPRGRQGTPRDRPTSSYVGGHPIISSTSSQKAGSRFLLQPSSSSAGVVEQKWTAAPSTRFTSSRLSLSFTYSVARLSGYLNRGGRSAQSAGTAPLSLRARGHSIPAGADTRGTGATPTAPAILFPPTESPNPRPAPA